MRGPKTPSSDHSVSFSPHNEYVKNKICVADYENGARDFSLPKSIAKRSLSIVSKNLFLVAAKKIVRENFKLLHDSP